MSRWTPKTPFYGLWKPQYEIDIFLIAIFRIDHQKKQIWSTLHFVRFSSLYIGPGICIGLFYKKFFWISAMNFRVRKALPNVPKLSLSETANKSKVFRKKKQTDCFCLSQWHFSLSGLQSMYSTFQDTFLWLEILCVFLFQSFDFFFIVSANFHKSKCCLAYIHCMPSSVNVFSDPESHSIWIF